VVLVFKAIQISSFLRKYLSLPKRLFKLKPKGGEKKGEKIIIAGMV